MKSVIGVFDSGVGGMTTLRDIQHLLPEVKCIYLRDNAHFPYGNKSEAALLAVTTEAVNKLQAAGAQIIVIACNTATTKCIRLLRERFPNLIFVGTEPAIKVAVDHGCKNILLLATENTVHSKQVERLINRYITSQKMRCLACPGLAEFVEKHAEIIGDTATLNLAPAAEQELRDNLNILFAGVAERERIDGVVLGCTHYVFLKNYLRPYFPRAEFVDGNEGVARRVTELLGLNREK